MTTNEVKTAAALAAVATVAASVSHGAENAGKVDDLIARIKSPDDAMRGPAWQHAEEFGAAAVKPLAAVMTDANFEIARAATRAVWRIVRHAGRPDAAEEAKAVAAQLLPLLASGPTVVRREVLWMLSEIAGDEAVAPMAALLSTAESREDARCALQRLPGAAATGALKQAMGAAPEDFKYALAESLRARGEQVSGYPSRKLVPTKQTTVKAPAKG